MTRTYSEEELPYRAGGQAMRGRLFRPAEPAGDSEAEGKGAILVFPEAPGPGPHVLGRAARLAALGYPALVCDLHGDALLLDGFPEILARLDALRRDPATVVERAEAALAALRSAPALAGAKVAAIGYCFGGTMALELGRHGADIAGAVGFHSGLAPLSDRNGIACPVLTCIGADDPSILPPERAAFEEEMRAAGNDWALHVYGGVVHAFTDPDIARIGRPDFARYDASADARSWQAMLQFLDQIF